MARKITADDSGFLQPDQEDELDPSVSGLIGQGQKRQNAARMSLKDRKRKKKAEEKYQADQAARQALVYLEPAVKAWADETARGLGCTSSQVINFAIHYLMEGISNSEVVLNLYTTPIQNPRYKVRLDYPQVSANPLNDT